MEGVSVETITAAQERTRGDRKCDKMAWNYLHVLYQCPFPGFAIVL